MITRRNFIFGGGAFAFGGLGLAGYGFGVEPFRIVLRKYTVSPNGWPRNLLLRIAILADIHAGAPTMTLERLRGIVARTNNLGADLIVLLGDYIASRKVSWRRYANDLWAAELGHLKAPLGVHAVLGNHDWWEDKLVQRRFAGLPDAARALDAVGIPVYHNDARRMNKDGHPFWLCGLGDQWAFYARRWQPGTAKTFGYTGADDLPGTIARIDDDAPAIMMVHEPDIFAEMPRRVAVTLAGHTHGGQVQLFGFAPIVPSRFGSRYLYGHVEEGGRHLIVSGGIGVSGLPVRFGRPPEIVIAEIGA